MHHHTHRHGTGWESPLDGLEVPDAWSLHLAGYGSLSRTEQETTMTKAELMPLAQQERSELLTLLGELTAAQWRAPSLCTGWSVREVAIHIVSYDELSKLQTAALFVSGGLRVTRINELALDRHRNASPSGVLDLVSRCQEPRGLTAAMGGAIALTDGTIHHQDIRRALALPRTISAEQLRAVLDFSIKAPTLPSRSNRRGLRLSATDLDWSSGAGPEVSGPAESLLMAVAGRPDALGELNGAGLATLRRRVARPGDTEAR